MNVKESDRTIGGVRENDTSSVTSYSAIYLFEFDW